MTLIMPGNLATAIMKYYNDIVLRPLVVDDTAELHRVLELG